MGISGIVGGILQKGLSHKVPYTSAVLLAAGIGSRMHSPDRETKQLRQIAGAPVLIHALRAFEACPLIQEIVIVARAEERIEISDLVQKYGIKKVAAVVCGGATRQESALSGFLAISEKAKFVAIHDAARCLIRSEDVRMVVVAAHAYRAATAASPVVDTIKSITPEGFIDKTLPRDGLVCAATPQAFEVALYRAAAYTAQANGDSVTDDNMLVESIGQAVKVVDCGLENFKITTEADLLRAEMILQKRGKENVP